MTRALALSSLLAVSSWAAAPEREKPRVAMLYFDIESPTAEHAVLKKGLAEMLIADLGNDPAITIVERGRLEEIVAELNLQASKKIDQSTALQMGKLLGAQYLVMGTLISQSFGTRLSAKLINGETGVVLGTAAEIVNGGDIFEAEAKISDKLTGLIAKAGARDTPPAKKKQGKLTIDNAVKYSQALDAIDKKDKKVAKEKLEAVVKAQPDFMLASLELDRLMK
ncbi:MAG: hypothetical protein JNK82_23385 [Myxococcaceae bacterium]|nr:hypothetical protein [Myxococcaceae bacterium]